MIDEINIGDRVEIFSVDEDGNEHQIMTGRLAAIFRSDWDGNLR